MRERHSSGSVLFDKGRNKWRFLQWVNGKRKSRVLGTRQEFPTKAAAWREAERIDLTTQPTATNEADTVRALAARYEAERFPTRYDTARVYRSWLKKHILPEWGDTKVSDIRPRPVELWLRSLALSPKSKSHVRNMMYMLMDFAMWSGTVELARNPIELVVVKGATKPNQKTALPHG